VIKHQISNAKTALFLRALGASKRAFEDYGFNPYSGAPIGMLYEIPEIVNAASQLVEGEIQRVAKKNKARPSASYHLYADDNSVWVEIHIKEEVSK
jgi:hypothetical protein